MLSVRLCPTAVGHYVQAYFHLDTRITIGAFDAYEASLNEAAGNMSQGPGTTMLRVRPHHGPALEPVYPAFLPNAPFFGVQLTVLTCVRI